MRPIASVAADRGKWGTIRHICMTVYLWCMGPTNSTECTELRGDELLNGARLLGSIHKLGLLSQCRAVDSRDYLRMLCMSVPCIALYLHR